MPDLRRSLPLAFWLLACRYLRQVQQEAVEKDEDSAAAPPPPHQQQAMLERLLGKQVGMVGCWVFVPALVMHLSVVLWLGCPELLLTILWCMVTIRTWLLSPSLLPCLAILLPLSHLHQPWLSFVLTAGALCKADPQADHVRGQCV